MELKVGMLFKTSYTPNHWCKITDIRDNVVEFVDTDNWWWSASVSFIEDCVVKYGKNNKWSVGYVVHK